MFGQSLLSAFGSTVACTTDTVQIFNETPLESIATYQLNNATTSIPSNTYPGTASNITYAAGKFGNAAVFNGSNSRINNNSMSVSLGSEFSISLWIKSGLNNTWQTILEFGSTVNDSLQLQKRGDNNKFRFIDQNSGVIIFDIDTSVATINQWFHYAVSVSSNSYSVYENGSYVGGGTYSSSQTQTGLALGYRQSNNSEYFNGSLDQVRIFNTALSAGAVKNLYNETVATASNSYINIPSCVAYYKMSDATDQTGSYNGTPTNVNFNVAGKFGNAGDFNGSSSKITNTNQVIPNGATSFSFWYNPSGATGVQYIIGSGVATASKGIAVGYTGSTGIFNVYIAKGVTALAANLSGTTAYSNTDWNNVSVIWDGTTTSNAVKLYVNGSLEAEGTSDTSSASIGAYTTFGIGGVNGGGYAEGKLDQVRIFNRVITATEVETLYNEVQCIPTIVPTDHFGPVIYTGNGTTQSISSLDFQPDMVWIKGRSTSSQDHTIVDSVRGISRRIRPSYTSAEVLESGFNVTAFNSDGFTLVDNTAGNYNVNGAVGGLYSGAAQYISWNWKAPLANLSTSFNGSSSYISAANILDTSSAFTYSLWVNPNTISNLDYLIGHQQAGSPYAGVGLLSGSSNRFYLALGGSTPAVMTPSLTLNSWSHIVLTHDGSGNYTCYTNNNGSPITYSGATSNNSSNPFRIGFSSVSGWNYFDGKIDQVRIFNSALSASEVSDLYAEPAASNNTLNYPAGAGCIAAYPLQTDAVDLSGNYNGASSNVTFSQPGYLTGNTNGTIPSAVAANVDAGFSIVSYTGNGLSNQTIGHGLGKTPDMIITKGLANLSTYDNWDVWHKDLTLNYILALQSTGAESFAGVDQRFVTSLNSDTVFGLGPDVYGPNSNGTTKIAYAFHSVDGYSKIGSYIGTGTVGNSIVTGFRPAYLMVKRTDSGDNWLVFDNKRNTTNPTNLSLIPNSSAAESVGNLGNGFNFLSNGFQVVSTDTGVNANGGSYIFMAIAEEVFVPEIPFEGGDFNGLEYQLVTNPTTGRTWLDRNLGATRVATSSTDSAAFGYYYQWGRLSDGHQIPTSSTTSTLSGSDIPGNSNFITSTVSPKDWRSPQNPSLWQGPQSYNNPCPPGFRLPTEAEILEEAASWGSQNSAGAFASNLKLPTGSGIRIETGGAPVDTGAGYIWTSTISGTDAKFYYVAGGGDFTSNYRRAAGCPVRPIKDE